jgi:DNA-binding transcriptional ArsR family regulator
VTCRRLFALANRSSPFTCALKDAGLVSDRRDGRSVYYALDPKALVELESFIREVRSRPLAP